MLSSISKKLGALTLAVACLVPCAPAGAQSVLFSEVHTVAAPTQAAPVEHTFTVTSAGNYQITLADLGAQLTPAAPLADVKLAVTSGAALVGTPLLMAGSTTVSATPGSYVIHVVGTPGGVPGSGPIGIQVTNTADNSVLATFSDTLALPQQALPSSEAVLADTFTAASGNYTVSIADLQLPTPLAVMTLLLIPQGSATPLLILSAPGTLSGPVALTAGVTYDIFAVGETSSTATGGLFSAVVVPSGGGAATFARTIAIGGTLHLGSPALAAGNYTLKLADLAVPAALSQLQAALVLNGALAAPLLAAAGTESFGPAPAGTYDAFAFAAPAAASGAGSYAFVVLPQGGGAAVFDVARGVATPGGNTSVYSFDTSLSAAGAYTLNAADFQFPAALTSLNVAAVQNAAVLGTAAISGGAATASGNLTGASGALTLLAFSQAGGAAGGLFGANLTASGAAAPAFEVTQGVGTAFSARQFTIANTGQYNATVSDLAFPASFANLDVLVTRGVNREGSIFGGGTFGFPGTPGTYFINFIAQPTGTDQAGTYAITVATAPPAPVVTLSTDHSQVSSGGTVDIIWSSKNATSCTASGGGGWSGSEALSGTATSAALTSSTTFTLTCTGAGGSASQSVTVTIAAPSSGGGGSGAIGVELLALLAGLLFITRWSRYRQKLRNCLD